MARSPYFDAALHAHASDQLHLAGMSQRTHEGYLRAVRQLVDFTCCSPDAVTEEQLRAFLMHLIRDRNFASGSLGAV